MSLRYLTALPMALVFGTVLLLTWLVPRLHRWLRHSAIPYMLETRMVFPSQATATLSAEEIAGVGVALNEALLLAVEIDSRSRVAVITLAVFSLPPKGPPPEDRRVQILLSPVGRVSAVYSTPSGDILPMRVDELLSTVEKAGGSIYGEEFIDLPFEEPPRTSLDLRFGVDGLSHKLFLFKDYGSNGKLDLWIWFDELSIRSPQGDVIALGDFIAAGKRWWEALYAGDERTADSYVHVIKPKGLT